MDRIIRLKKYLESIGEKNAAKKVNDIMKIAYINNAFIEVSVFNNEIIANLIGTVKDDSGNQAKTSFGRVLCERKTEGVAAGNPSLSVWEIHRDIWREEYQGLGYMQDLLIAAIVQVENNGGIAYNHITSYSSEEGQSHTLNSLKSTFNIIPVVAILNGQQSIVFENEDELKNINKSIIPDELTYLFYFLKKSFLSFFNFFIKNPFMSQVIDYFRIQSGFRLSPKRKTPSIPIVVKQIDGDPPMNFGDPSEIISDEIIKIEQTLDEVGKKITEFIHDIATYINSIVISKFPKTYVNIINEVKTIINSNLNDYIINKNKKSSEDISTEIINKLLNYIKRLSEELVPSLDYLTQKIDTVVENAVLEDKLLEEKYLLHDKWRRAFSDRAKNVGRIRANLRK